MPLFNMKNHLVQKQSHSTHVDGQKEGREGNENMQWDIYPGTSDIPSTTSWQHWLLSRTHHVLYECCIYMDRHF